MAIDSDPLLPAETLGQLDWRFTRTQAEWMIMCGRLGLTPVQSLVIMEALNEHQLEIDKFVRAGFGVPDTSSGVTYPLSDSMAEAIASVSQTLEMQMDDSQREVLQRESLELLDLAGMSENDILQAMHRISQRRQ